MTQADRHHKHRQVANQKVALATLASEPKFSAAVISIINTTTMMLPRVLCRHRDLFISFGSSRSLPMLSMMLNTANRFALMAEAVASKAPMTTIT